MVIASPIGHLIFEMSTGHECKLAMPEPHDLSIIRHNAVVEVCVVIVNLWYTLSTSN